MTGVHNGSVVHVDAVRPRSTGFRLDAHFFLGVLLAVIFVGSVAGVVITALIGRTDIALIVAIIAGAFFSRIRC
jgi:hypothetical protein